MIYLCKRLRLPLCLADAWKTSIGSRVLQIVSRGRILGRWEKKPGVARGGAAGGQQCHTS